MGTVYKAVDETLDRTVAIKVLNADLLDQDSVERFRREAITLARLNHPRIGAIHELTRDGHDLLMVMEFIQGETFEKLIERSAPLSIADAVRLCAQVLDGLQYAHGAGVVHRDLKPANVIVTPSGDIKIMDFGIARVQGSEHLTSVGFMVGTPAYMSPEQVRGEEVDPRMDLYSVAVVLYRLLTHRLPFEGNTAIAMIHSQLSNAPTPARQFRADLPDWIVAALTRGLAKLAGDRFQTAHEFRTALEQGLTGTMAIVDILGPSHAETMGPTMTPPAMRVPQTQGTGIAAQPATASSAVRQAPTLPSGTQPVPGSVSAAPSAVSPQPAATPTALQATVTLRAPHLATAGILVAVLVAGIGVLAFVALRRSAPTPAPATAGVSAPGTAPLEATPPAAPTQTAPAVVEKPATPTPAAVPAPTPSAPNTTGSAARATTTPAETPARGRSGSPAAPAVATAAPSTPATPAAADAPAEHFADLKILTMDGAKGREVDALLGLEPGTLVVRAKDGRVLRTLTYRSVTAATYARARRPKGQAIPNAIDIPENFGGSGFLGGARHWLALQTAGEFLILRLEDRNVIRIMQAIEARTGLTVVRSQD